MREKFFDCNLSYLFCQIKAKKKQIFKGLHFDAKFLIRETLFSIKSFILFMRRNFAEYDSEKNPYKRKTFFFCNLSYYLYQKKRMWSH